MRLERGELLSAACGLALLVLMFGFAWYGISGIHGQPATQRTAMWTEDGWDALTIVRWLILLTAIVALTPPLLRLRGSGESEPPAGAGALVFLLGGLTSVLLTYRVLLDLPDPSAVSDQKLGAVLAVISAAGIAVGGWSSVALTRARIAARQRAR